MFSKPVLTVVILLLGVACSQAANSFAQGGGNANATGIALENAVQNSAKPNSGESSGSPSGPPQPDGAAPNSEPGDEEMMNDGLSEDDPDYGGSGVTFNASPGGWDRSSGTASGISKQFAQSLASLFNTPPDGAAPYKRPLTLWEQAALALYQGNQTRALALYHAHLVADGDEAAAALASVKYSRLLKRPVWAVRFGLSILPRVPSEFATDPEPLRKDTKIATPNMRARGVIGTPDSAENEGMAASDDAMSDDSLFDGGATGVTPSDKAITTLGGPSTEEAARTVDRNLGLVADVFKSLFSAQLASGKFGNAFDGMETKGAVLVATHQDSMTGTSNGNPMWIPGIDFLGEGPSSEMLQKAKANRIDILLHFDVIVKANRIGPPHYTTRCSLIQVDSGTTLGVSKAIDKYEIASKAALNETTVRELLATLFEIIDKKVSVEPMPALTALHATSRIDSLLGSKEGNSLRSLAEMNMFHRQRLLTPEQLDQAFYYAGGDLALQLLHDEQMTKYQKVNEFVENELSAPPLD